MRAKHEDLGITAERRKSFDVEVLATFMGVSKEGPSAGITIVTGIVSALKKVLVRNDLAMSGEITIMGKVLPVGGIQQKVRAAYDAGVKEVLLPADNLKEAEGFLSYVPAQASRLQSKSEFVGCFPGEPRRWRFALYLLREPQPLTFVVEYSPTVPGMVDLQQLKFV
ncbi:MAG: S16 family serine protease [Deltaproteobacteria bacterium]|nr:S16 family serine protease [Deltaproteobacteria bacterium]